jgi:ATP-binding cassette subfamily B (MDR/TAP) protein 1
MVADVSTFRHLSTVIADVTRLVLASGEYSPVQFFVIYMAVVNGAEGAGSLLSFSPNMAQASAAANRILSFRVRQKSAGKEILDFQDGSNAVQIVLKDVWFKYPTRDTPVFTGLNLTVSNSNYIHSGY